MEYMFYGCASLENINLKRFDTKSVTNMGHMFEKCTSLTSIDLSTFDTHVTENMEYMFADDINLIYLNFKNFNESNIKKINNILQGTLSNMIFCFNEATSPKLSKIVEEKGCPIVDCSNDPYSKRKKIIATTNQCVDECTGGFAFLFDYKCFYKCPVGTYPDNFICKHSFNQNTNISEECDIKNYLLGKCKYTLNDYKQKRKLIDKTVNSILNSELYELVSEVIDKKKNIIAREENEVYHIYSLKNKNRENNLTYIDFGECGARLNNYYQLAKEDDILIFKIEYTSPDFKIPIIEYVFFGIYGKKN